MIKQFFSPPVFEKAEDNFRARVINIFAWVVIAIVFVSIVSGGFDLKFSTTDLVLLGLAATQGLALYFLRRGNLNISGAIIVILGWIGLSYQAYQSEGVRDVIIVAYIALALFSSVVVGWYSGGIIILASIGVIWGLALLETNGYITPGTSSPTGFARDLSFIFAVITALIYIYTLSMRDAILRANKSEEELRISNKSLQDLNLTLEDRVSSRTKELEEATQKNEKRARQFEAVAQVARAIAMNVELDSLLPQLSSLISQQFEFYHTGIFLLDSDHQFAVLRAANSEGGKRMLKRGHKLQVGQTGIVGFVSAVGTARIVSDVGVDAVYFDNPDLPNTHSEMAIPLRTNDEIIGVLDVQSTESNAFTDEDVEILSTLADQVTIAIQNAENFEKMKELLSEAQKTSSVTIQDVWRTIQDETSVVGYRAAGSTIDQLTRPLSSAPVLKAIEQSETVSVNGKNAAVAIPIRLREEVIGVIDIRTPNEHEWDKDDIDIAEAVADRLSLALETSLLLKSTQRRAELERITTNISAKVGESTQFASILRTAAEELSRALGGSEVLVQLQGFEENNSTDSGEKK